jgi:DNA-binding response OmpR family regulator
MATVLVVDDEPVVRDVVVRYLERDGYLTHVAADGAQARSIIDSTPLDLIVLDVMLPEVSGFDLCRWIRSNSSTPVIMLTARTEESDRIVGLELGADDYVTKPFSPRELVARVRAVLRRTGSGPDDEPATSTGLQIDAETRRVRRDGVEIELTAKEFDLLAFLCRHPGQVFTRAQLLTQVWGFDAELDVGGATVTVHMRRLRTKVEHDPSKPRHLQTVRGVGYRFEP